MPEGRLGGPAGAAAGLVHGVITPHRGPSALPVILWGMSDAFRCHECGGPLAEGEEAWLRPEDGAPDSDAGEPYCPGCAAPLGLAA